MSEKKSRRDFLSKGILTAGVAAAASSMVSQALGQDRSIKSMKSQSMKSQSMNPQPMNSSGLPNTPERMKPGLTVNRVPSSKLTPIQMERGQRAQQAVATLKELGQDVQVQWVQGTGKPQRRIVQLYG